MPDAPTTEGSIVAFLKLDDSDFVEKLDRAEQKARDLDRIDPRIRVEADTTDALARLEQIRMAESEVGGGRVIRTTTVNNTEDTTSTTERVARTVTDTAVAAGADDHAAALLRDADAAQQATTAMDRLAPAEEAVSRVVELDAVQLASHAEKASAAAEAALQLSGVEASSTGPVDEVAAARKRATDALAAARGAADRASVAQKNLSDAQSMASDAAATYAHALQGLNDDIHNASLSASRLQESYIFARESADVAAAASTALAGAERDAAAAAGEVEAAAGGAGDAVDGAGRKVADAGKNAGGGAGGFRILTGVIVGLIPAIAPLAGYAVGVSGALAGMGAAGVLAVLGIKREMADGSVQGQKYSDLLQTVQGDLHALEATAATGVLGPFSNIVGEIDGHLPQLDSEIGSFATGLGGVAEVVVATLVPGFQIVNPLFEQAAQYVQRLAVEWQQWTVGGGLNQFAASAEQALPIVAADLGNLASIAMKLIVGLAPLGTTALQAIEAVSGVLAALPTPVVFGMAAAVSVWFGKMSLWRTIQPLLTRIGQAFELLGADEEVALGPIGLVAAAVTALGIGVAGAAMSTQQASTDTQDYTVMLEQSNGVIDESIRKQTANKLLQDGLADSARKYGISLSQLTDAVLNGGPALDATNATLRQSAQEYTTVTRNANGSVSTTIRYAGAAGKLMQAIDGQNRSFELGKQNQKSWAMTADTSTSAASAQSIAQQNLTDQLNQQNNSVLLLNTAFQVLNNQSLNVALSSTADAASINALTSSLRTNGAAVLGNTTGQVSNRQALLSAITAAQTNEAAVLKQTGSQEKATAAYEASRRSIENAIQAVGGLTGAVKTYINTNMQIPAFPKVDTSQATAALRQLQSQLGSFQNQAATPITVGVSVQEIIRTTGPTAQGHALGGSVYGTVIGPGTNNSDSVLTALSAGEEVVSDARGQASKYRPLLQAINNGASAPQVAAAALNTTGMTATAPQVTHINHFHVTTNNPEQLFQAFTAYTNRRALV